MARVDQLQSEYAYHFATLARMMDLSAALSAEQFTRETGYGHESVYSLLLHVLATDRSWRGALETGERPRPLEPQDYPGLTELRKLLSKERAAWQDFLSELTDAMLEQELQLSAGPGRSMAVPRWRVIDHVLLHGMQHISELAYLLTEYDQSPGNIDFIFYSQT